jgi:transcriptional regulator GlxA family with amidase domain
MKRRDALILAAGAGITAATKPTTALGESSLATVTIPQGGVANVAVVVGPGTTVIDFAGPWNVFASAVGSGDTMPFKLFAVSDKADVLRMEGDMALLPDYAFHDTAMPKPNIIVIPAQGEHTPAKIGWIKKASQHADVTMSVCTGAFLLAQTGLLNGLRATTHHDFYEPFEKAFPNVTVVRDVRFVENEGGRLCTAGGESSGIDLSLRVVQRYLGSEIAARTAYYMEYAPSTNRPSLAHSSAAIQSWDLNRGT